MIRLPLLNEPEKPFHILCLGAHSDDIEIGCGGVLLHLQQIHPKIGICWVVFSALGVRGEEAAKSAESYTECCEQELVLKQFRDGFLPYHGAEVKDCFEELKARVRPDLIFTHWRGDAHQDHRLISELTWNTFRDHLILEYEIPKYDGDLGQPNVFVPLDSEVCTRKIDLIMGAFQSQSSKRWFEENTFRSLMRLRGMECNAPSGYAEAFHCRKMVL